MVLFLLQSYHLFGVDFLKNYIIIPENTTGRGGSFLYYQTKINWLIDDGWQVYVLAHDEGKMYFTFQNCEYIPVAELNINPFILSTKQREKILSRIDIATYFNNQEVIVESSSFDFAIWGDVLAKRYGGRNLIFVVGEELKRINPSMKHYLRYKLDNNELAFIKSMYVQRLFPDVSSVEATSHQLVAWMDNNPDADFLYTPLPDEDFNIGFISRLNKSFVQKALADIKKFAEKHTDTTFSLTVIGDATDSVSMNDCKKILDGSKNLKVVFTGWFDTIPMNLLQSFDVTVGKAGCASLVYRNNMRAITYAMDEDICMGVLGYDLNENILASEGKHYEIEDVLYRLVYTDEYSLDKMKKCTDETGYCDFTKHLEYINSHQVGYYNVKKVRPSFVSISKSLWVLLFNNCNYIRILKLFKIR